MLLKIERKILNKLCKNNSNDISANTFKYPKEAVYQAMKDLETKGYIHTVSTSEDWSVFTYVLNTKGRYYREYIFRMLLRNILIPIFVSIITTLLTLAIQDLINSNSNKACNYTYEYWENPINENPK